eukprot:gene1764-2186_t
MLPLRGVVFRAKSASLAIALFGLIFANSATAGTLPEPANPWKRLGAHLFDEEHAHLLGDSLFDKINPLVLAAMPRGPGQLRAGTAQACLEPRFRSLWPDHRQFDRAVTQRQPQGRRAGKVLPSELPGR